MTHALSILGKKTLAIVLAASPVLAVAAPFAYVPNEASGAVSVIDTATDRAIDAFKAGSKPRGLAVGKNGKRLYISDQPNNALMIIDLEKRALIGKVDLGESPEGIDISHHRPCLRPCRSGSSARLGCPIFCSMHASS